MAHWHSDIYVGGAVLGLSTPGNFSFILHRLLTNVQLQILQNSLLEIGIPCTEIRGDPLTDPLQDGGGRIGRLEFWKRAQSPPISDTLTRSGLSADSSGPRGRGFKSRHSDQKLAETGWFRRVFVTFESGWIF